MHTHTHTHTHTLYVYLHCLGPLAPEEKKLSLACLVRGKLLDVRHEEQLVDGVDRGVGDLGLNLGRGTRFNVPCSY